MAKTGNNPQAEEPPLSAKLKDIADKAGQSEEAVALLAVRMAELKPEQLNAAVELAGALTEPLEGRATEKRLARQRWAALSESVKLVAERPLAELQDDEKWLTEPWAAQFRDKVLKAAGLYEPTWLRLLRKACGYAAAIGFFFAIWDKRSITVSLIAALCWILLTWLGRKLANASF